MKESTADAPGGLSLGQLIEAAQASFGQGNYSEAEKLARLRQSLNNRVTPEITC